MPTVSGLELVARLREMNYTGRIIVFSSELSEAVDTSYRNHKVDFILPKPVFPPTFALCSRHCSSQASAGGPAAFTHRLHRCIRHPAFQVVPPAGRDNCHGVQLDTSDLLARFLRYVQIDTRSFDQSPSTPSTPGQWDLLRLLETELQQLDLADVELTEHGYLLATLPATSAKATPVIAWFAHVDTAPNLPGAAKPIVHRAYDGRPIVLPDDATQKLTLDSSPCLRDCLGHDIITASGTTLLGSDDKSGVAVIMAAVRHLLRHLEIPHGKLRLCFNP